MNPVRGQEIAGVGIRSVGYLVDLLVNFCLAFLAGYIAGLLIGVSGTRMSDSSLEALGQVVYIGATYSALWLFNSIGWSPGKSVVGLRIVRADGEPPGVATGLGRTAASLLSGVLFGMGYWSAFWAEDHRTWHDQLAGTYVVKTR